MSFNNVSDRPRNPSQQADAIELETMRYFRQNQEEKIRFVPFDNESGQPYYLYARPIWIEEFCLKCHGKRSEAPETIRKLYSTAYDYKLGDLRGILSIKLPAAAIQKQAVDHLWYNMRYHLGVLFVLILSTFFLVRYYLSRPLQQITSAMESVSNDKFRHDLVVLSGEFAEPSRIFNQMARTIITQKTDLQEMLNSLDQKVKQRTSELDSKVTELTITRSELIASEKMASLGRLVAGFAHEVNTPIGVAVSAVSSLDENARTIKQLLTRDEVTEEELLAVIEPMTEASALIQSNLQRAAGLITSFKRTAIDQSVEHSHLFNVAEGIEDLIHSLHNQFKHTSIKIHVECEENLTLYSNQGVLDQLLTNLLLNSLVHGFHHGEDEGTIQIVARKLKENFYLEYSDDGKGIDTAHLDQIFEPFFTTSRQHGGSGLGLYICYNLVTTQLKGTIQCDNLSDQGTRFIIQFPIQHQD